MNLTDKHLIEKTDELVKEERKLLLDMLHHLKEIERRRLFCDLGYKSIFDMMTKRYGYSEKEAYSRLSAMHLLKELPQVEEKIKKGELNLTNITLMQTLFKQEKKSGNTFKPEEKLEALDAVSNKSTRETEVIRLQLSSNPKELTPDRITHVTEDKIEMRFTANATLQRKLEKLRGIRAHKNPNQNLGELFEELIDQALEAAARPKRRVKKITIKTTAKQTETAAPAELPTQNKPKTPSETNQPEPTCRCTNCHSYYAPESDHIIPKAKGGSDEQHNRRMLCRNCNQRAAIKHYGQIKMDLYIN